MRSLTRTLSAAIAVWATASACTHDVTNASDLTHIVVLPRVVTLALHADTQFFAFGVRSNGDSGVVTPTWSADGGSITTSGRYTAPGTQGSYHVRALLNGLSDSAVVTAASVVIKLAVLPESTVVGPGGTIQFSAVGIDAQSDTTPATVAWSATSGVIDLNGHWTAPDTAVKATITGTNGALSAHAVVLVNVPSVVEPTFRAGVDTMMWSDDFSQYTSSANLFAGYNQSSQNGGSLNLDKAIFVNDSQSLRIDWDSAGCLGGNDANVHIEKSVGKLDLHKEWVASYYTRFSAGYMFYWSAGGCSRGVSAKELVSYASGQTLNGKWSIVAHAFGSNELATACPTIFQSGISSGLLWGFFLDGSDSGTAFPAASCASVAYPQHLAIGSKDPNSLVDGQWHHITVRTRKQSALDVGDGIVQMWVDGVLVMNYDGSDPSSLAYHKVFVRIQSGQYAPFWLAGIFNAGSPKAQSRWFDEIRFWYRPN